MIPFPDARVAIQWREPAVNSRRGEDDGPNRMGRSCALRRWAGDLVRLHGEAGRDEADPRFLLRADDPSGRITCAFTFGRVR